MQNNKQPELLIPYFEYLRLVTFMLASEPRRLICLGSISIAQNSLIVNRFSLPQQEQQHSLEKQLESIVWDLSTVKSDHMPLLVLSDCLLVLPHDISGALQTTLKFMLSSAIVGVSYNQLTIMLIGGRHEPVANYFLVNPFLMSRSLEVYLSMPQVDDSARAHFIQEYKESLCKDQDRQIPDDQFPPAHYYAHQYLAGELFFTEPGLDITRVKTVKQN